ncbi:MAG: hypothetical protein MI673_07895, partial [Thiotrichales bacterium]|nr:hypothetical protein [Thiotrichales bacterium]
MPSDAIIFIPGIKGTKLVNTNLVNHDVIWSAVQSNFETIEDLELTRQFQQQYYDENPDTIIEPGELEEFAYREFMRDLNPGKPIYIFNYDWRFSTVENAYRLEGFIDYLVEKSTASKDVRTFKSFDFITHSLGNYVLRAYLHRFGFDRTNKVVFTVPPFKGSLNIVSVAVVGEGFFDNVKSKIRKLIRTMPGALELLPTYDKASVFDSGRARHSFFNPDHWQSNLTRTRNVTAEKKELAEKFLAVLKTAKSAVNNHLLDLHDLSASEKRKCLVMTRTGYDTWQSLKVIKDPAAPNPENYIDFENSLRTKNGDGSVADASSCCYHDAVKTLSIRDAFFFRDYGHGLFLKDERVQRIIRRFL